ncbi:MULTISPECIES: hypothetical protein [unclassified Janthinobacterium]|uniref:hypothetical protein n=1 Tax=unclassified Janthinobacterium TaxID=2610881 RepID=UPI0012FC05B5|nr:MULTISPECIES: hypothetical protein [unclassified Janthinobacterium]MEC5164229.1 hypothetical protein [Janthinobacterium sp. CG_S6]
MKNFFLLITLPFIFGCTNAQENKTGDSFKATKVPVKEYNCTSNPCGNTATGEDPSDISGKKGAAILDEIRYGDEDKLRWTAIALSSDSEKNDNLKITLIRAVNFKMQLNPILGNITFSKSGVEHTFQIASPRGEKGGLCPEYTITVNEASSSHAIIKKSCLRYNYKPGRYFMSVDYYLYDFEIAIMRNIWRSSVQINSPLPEAKPTPAVKKIKNGYRFDWIGMFPSDNLPSKMEIHNTYLREKDKKGSNVLICTDTSAPRNKGIENEMCEGEVLTRVSPR